MGVCLWEFESPLRHHPVKTGMQKTHKNTMSFQSVDRNLLLDTRIYDNVAVSFNENQRFCEIFKENSLCSNCSKLGIMQDLFEMIKKRLSSKKDVFLNG